LTEPVAIKTKKNVDECEDTIDNDKDGLIDWPYDPQCHNKNDDDESS
jgi:hypothetical protein